MDWEGAIRNLAEEGKVSVCVPAALKDSGIPVPTEYFTRAMVTRAMDVVRVAQELGYTAQEIEGMDLQTLYRDLDTLRKNGQFPLLKIGRPTPMGVLGQHVNAVIAKAEVEKEPGFVLGGIPPFGKDKGNTFSLNVLERVMPQKDGIIILQKTQGANPVSSK